MVINILKKVKLFSAFKYFIYLCIIIINQIKQKVMLDNKKNYVGRQVEVFNTGVATVDNKVCKVIGQFEHERGGLIFEINRSNPKSKKNEPLCVKESNVKFV